MNEIQKKAPVQHLNPWTENWHSHYGGPEIKDDDADLYPDHFTTQDPATRELLHINTRAAWDDYQTRDRGLREALYQHELANNAPEGRDKNIRVRQTYDSLLRMHNGDENMLKMNLNMYNRDSEMAERQSEMLAEHHAERAMYGAPDEEREESSDEEQRGIGV
jgi:hypothetical protein